MVYIKSVPDMEWTQMGHGSRYGVARKALTPQPSRDGGPAPRIGTSLYRLSPGKRAWPRHRHMANDEIIYILAGAGTLIYGDTEHAVKVGDYVHMPAQGEAHQLYNSGTEDLDYLCVSTMIEPEIVLYPDSNKAGVFAGSATGGDPETRTLWEFLDRRPHGYWDGEDAE